MSRYTAVTVYRGINSHGIDTVRFPSSRYGHGIIAVYGHGISRYMVTVFHGISRYFTVYIFLTNAKCSYDAHLSFFMGPGIKKYIFILYIL